MRILIAEDDKTSRNLLTVVLTKQGHEVVATINGAEALQAMQQPDAPGLAILDWMMPEMDGPEVVVRLRAVKTDQPPYIIMLTAKSEKADIIVGLDAGADDYLSKPFDPGELRARIEVGRRILELQANLHTTNMALAHEASHDSLTDLYNRRAIMDILSREPSREERQRSGMAIGICDIDHFKKINDTYGHLVGDEVLCGFARNMERCLRTYDSLGRFGGEEFVVITPGIKENDAYNLYERFRVAIEGQPIVTRAGSVSISLSIGVVIWSGTGKADEMLAVADAALYQAKNGGRNRVCLTDARTLKL